MIAFAGSSPILCSSALREELDWFISLCEAPRVRPMREWAEAELVLPSGPFKGQQFRVDRQPYAKLFFEELESGRWQWIAATGPSQAGKTLHTWVIPALWHLFEVGEDVICAVYDGEMKKSKWEKDLLPSIKKSRYASMLPKSGGGSRGGDVDSITFANGATLRFMIAGTSDKGAASYTARVLIVTEVDGFGFISEASDEATKLQQLRARLRSFGEDAIVYLECTVSTVTGPIWQAYTEGSEAKIALQCFQCLGWVTPERKHLVNWQEARSAIHARELARVACPECGALWTEEHRRKANQSAKLLHRGQSVDSSGNIVGDYPETECFGFRFTAMNNMFTSIPQLGKEEWLAARMANHEAAEREMKQFVWCIPLTPDIENLTELTQAKIMVRKSKWEQSIAPTGSQMLLISVDVHRYHIDWLAKCFDETPIGYTIDYGSVAVASRQLGEDVAIRVALEGLCDSFNGMFCHKDGQIVLPDSIMIDSGYMTDVVLNFCAARTSNKCSFIPSKGLGYDQYTRTDYQRPRATSNAITRIGDGWHVVQHESPRIEVVHIDANEWKTRTHSRLECDPTEPGAILLFASDDPLQHRDYALHLTAEKKIEKTLRGRVIVMWEKIRKANHNFDLEAMANVLGDMNGFRSLKLPQVQPEERRTFEIPAHLLRRG